MAGIVVFGLFVALHNFFTDPVTSTSHISDGYWGGYYDTGDFGRIHCLSKFYGKAPRFSMVLVSLHKTVDVFDVETRSGDSFVQFSMKERTSPNEIEARQLYRGKRYMIGRLMVGRFTDFWARNDDDAIRGHVTSLPANPEFAIERLPTDKVLIFCNQYVTRDRGFSTLSELDALLAVSAPK